MRSRPILKLSLKGEVLGKYKSITATAIAHDMKEDDVGKLARGRSVPKEFIFVPVPVYEKYKPYEWEYKNPIDLRAMTLKAHKKITGKCKSKPKEWVEDREAYLKELAPDYVAKNDMNHYHVHNYSAVQIG